MSMTKNEENMSIKHAVCVLEAIGNGLALKNENDKESACSLAIQAIDKVLQFEAIGTIEEFKALKEKNTPMELAEHNFQDEVHHYLCPSCRSIVSCTQNYCEECGQALEH